MDYAVSEKEEGATGVAALTRMKWSMMMIFWQRIARVIGFQKCMVWFGLNHYTLEKTCDVTPVTDVRTEEEESGKCSSCLADQKPQKNLTS